MRKLYMIPIVLFATLFSGCSKDFLKRYDERIIGSWRLAGVNRFGLTGGFDHLDFRGGIFRFEQGGQLFYTDPAGNQYEGTWDLDRVFGNDQARRTLHVTVADFQNQRVLSEYYEDMNFLSTNHFRAVARSRFSNYVTHFRR